MSKPTSTDLTTPETYGLALPPTSFSDNIDPAEDVAMPWFYLKHSSSKYEEGDEGDIVLSQGDEKIALFPASTPVPSALVFADKFWQQNIPYNDRKRNPDLRPQRAYTLADKVELEKVSDYPVIPMFSGIFLLRHTADSFVSSDDDIALAEAFPFELDGERWVAGKIEAKFQGYDATAKRLVKFEQAHRGVHPSTVFWSFTSTRQENKQKDAWHIPDIKVIPGNPGPEVMKFISDTVRVLSAQKDRYSSKGGEA